MISDALKAKVSPDDIYFLTSFRWHFTVMTDTIKYKKILKVSKYQTGFFS